MDDQETEQAREVLRHIQMFWHLDESDIEVKRLGPHQSRFPG